MCGQPSQSSSTPNFQDPGFQQFLQSWQPQSNPYGQQYSTTSMQQPSNGVSMDPSQASQFRSINTFQPSGQIFGGPPQMSSDPSAGQQFGGPPPMSINTLQPQAPAAPPPGFAQYMQGTGIDPNSPAGQAMLKSFTAQHPQGTAPQTPQAPQGPGDNSMGSAYYNANQPGQTKGIVLSEGPKPGIASNPLSGSIPGMPWWGQQVGDTYLQGPTAGLLGGAAAAGGSPSPGYQFNVQQQRWMMPPK